MPKLRPFTIVGVWDNVEAGLECQQVVVEHIYARDVTDAKLAFRDRNEGAGLVSVFPGHMQDENTNPRVEWES